MQSASSRIWTHVAMSISYDDNHYTTGTSKEMNCLHLLTDVFLRNYKKTENYHQKEGKSLRGVVVNIVVNEIKLQSCYYVHFWTNTLCKSMSTLIPPAMG